MLFIPFPFSIMLCWAGADDDILYSTDAIQQFHPFLFIHWYGLVGMKQ